jgi:hypothetical protein
MKNNNNKKFYSTKIFTNKYSNSPSSSPQNINSSPKINTNNQSNLKNNSSNITLPNIQKPYFQNNKHNISNNNILPNFSSQISKYPQISVPPPQQKVDIKTGIFDSIKAGFFISMGSRLFDGIFGSRELKVIENNDDNKCLELKEMLDKCMKENNESCKDFYDKMKNYNCKL